MTLNRRKTLGLLGAGAAAGVALSAGLRGPGWPPLQTSWAQETAA